MCIPFQICEKRPFQRCMGFGGGVLTFLNRELHIGRGTQTCTAQLHHVYSESSPSFMLPLSGKAGTPLGQTSPYLWTGIYFFISPLSCRLGSFTGTHPLVRGIAHRPSAVRSTFRCLVTWTLHQGMASLYPDFNHT